MGYSSGFLILEGRHIADINRILEVCDYTSSKALKEIKNIKEADEFFEGYNPGDTFIVGESNGWTLLMETSCNNGCDIYLEEISALIKGRVFSISIETHCGYYSLSLYDKGHMVRNLIYEDGNVTDECGPLPVETELINKIKEEEGVDGGEEGWHIDDLYLFKVVSGITNADWAALVYNTDVLCAADRYDDESIDFDKCVVINAS